MENKIKITVYSSPDCAYCYTLKAFLEEKGFEYEDINIYEDTKAYEKMQEISDQKNVPVTIIGEKVLVGWNKDKLKEALNL